MTSKEIIDIIRQRVSTIRLNTKIGSRAIADKENAVLLDHIDYNLDKLYELDYHDEPKRIIKETVSLYVNEEYYYKVDMYKCPSCEKVVLYDRWQEIALHTTNKHCQHCGQKLEWSDDK